MIILFSSARVGTVLFVTTILSLSDVWVFMGLCLTRCRILPASSSWLFCPCTVIQHLLKEISAFCLCRCIYECLLRKTFVETSACTQKFQHAKGKQSMNRFVGNLKITSSSCSLQIAVFYVEGRHLYDMQTQL